MAALITDKKAETLKEALITLTSPIRKPAPIQIFTDNILGFQALAKGDQQLSKLHIKLDTTDPFNKNANAVADKRCQELEQELRKIQPEMSALSPTQLAEAVLALNNKIRRQAKVTAFVIHSNRDSQSG